ncbi:MAG TPA: hypothetical protein VM223_20895, partial [Planctomycetota bacterium]|nr:hypothetical protein [Planctomycetota bacterium]
MPAAFQFLLCAAFLCCCVASIPAGAAPLINVWYGEDQIFGPHIPQPFVNILGSVRDPAGLAWLSYSLNGGPPMLLSIGPDGRRLECQGDFNADIPVSMLAAGANEVRFTARNTAGEESTAVVHAIYLPSAGAALPLVINWASVANVQDVAFAVDGFWTIENGGVRCLPPAYDRILAFGEQSWQDYDVVVPIAIHQAST